MQGRDESKSFRSYSRTMLEPIKWAFLPV
jgi:hypothetical protein